jgi:hypothetical protein
MMRRWLWLLAAAAALLAAPPAAAKAPAGSFYAGFTPQRWPIAVQLGGNQRQVVRIGIGLSFTCTTGSLLGSDSFEHLAISGSRRFSSRYANDRVDNPNGTFTVYFGAVRARLNRAATKISGTWQESFTLHDATGAVTNTCDSGVVRWTARQ